MSIMTSDELIGLSFPSEPQNGTPPKTLHASLHEEHQYLKLIRDILDHGEHRPDR